MPNTRNRALSKIYERDLGNFFTNKKSIYYSIQNIYPRLFDYTHYPRKKKKKLKTAYNKFMSE